MARNTENITKSSINSKEVAKKVKASPKDKANAKDKAKPEDNKTKKVDNNKLEKLKFNKICQFLITIDDKDKRNAEMSKYNINNKDFHDYTKNKAESMDKRINNMKMQKDMLKKICSETYYN